MNFGADKVWLIPLLPLLAAAALAFVRANRVLANAAAIGSMAAAFGLSVLAFFSTPSEPNVHPNWNFTWLEIGRTPVELGFLLDPLTACMLLMVTFIGLLIFIFSMGYMADDPRYTRFFCYMSLFAAGMLGVVVANSLLLLFICWEIVGVASYLLIGFWYDRPSAAAAAKKAFITTRIGDLGLFLAILWLFSASGTLLFYDGSGNGILDTTSLGEEVSNPILAQLASTMTPLGVTAATGIALLIFWGAMGKSGQVPLHVWLPDAMEGPTPVSALIHAATMVAAGVFLVARVYPIMDVDPAGIPATSTALTIVTWIGAITALFAALIAVAQTDIKRILAYSTVSQLGYMMMGLGMGGVFVGIFHLITHAFFKALLFLGAGSVIHGSHHEQDICRMGGLRKAMPITFATYAVGMMALAGVPLFFSGFWSKDEILHAAAHWGPSKWPLVIGLLGAFLTAFYMTRQVIYVFFGTPRSHHAAHESPRVMTVPLVILAACAILVGFIGTPAYPWFEAYLTGHHVEFSVGKLFAWGVLGLMLLSTVVVGAGLAAGYFLYGRQKLSDSSATDPLCAARPAPFRVLRNRFYVDEMYEATIVRFAYLLGRCADFLEKGFFATMDKATGIGVMGLSWVNRCVDLFVIDKGFDQSCRGLRAGGGLFRRTQNGRSQNYLRAIAVGVAVLVLLLVWGANRS